MKIVTSLRHFATSRHPIRYFWTGLVLLFLSGVGGNFLLAQSEAGGAALHGVVVDEQGAGVAGAAVTLKNLDNGFARTLVSDSEGKFSAQAIPVGHYQLEASSTTLGSSRTVDVNLTVGGSESILLTVRSEIVAGTTRMVVKNGARMLNAEETTTSSTVGQRLIEEAPIRGRAFPDFVLLTPGVVQESSANGLAIAGQRSINSNVSIDGSDFNDPLRGNQRGGNDAIFFFPLSAVREFQVVNGGATAEVGRTTAGFVNVVTRSGGNEWHGEGFYLNRNSALTSHDAFRNPVDNSQHQFGGTVGGPLKRERIFQFVSAEQNLWRTPFVVAFQPQLAGVSLPENLAALQGPQMITNNITALFARTDVRVNPHHNLNLQYSYTRLDAQNFSAAGAATTSQAQTAYSHRLGDSHGGRVSLISSSSSSLVNELRGQVATDVRDEMANLALPLINISGVGQIGGDAGRPRIFESTRYQLSDNLSFTRRTHNLRVGADWNLNAERQQQESNIDGRYDFSSLGNFLAGKFSRYRGTVSAFGPDALLYSGNQQNFALFAQDKLRLKDNLTVTLGMRWEGQRNPQPAHPNAAIPETLRIPNDLQMWQPRAGLAWDVRGSGKMVVRLSAGIYAANTPGTLLQRAFTDNGLTSLALDSNFDPTILKVAPYPNALTTVPPGVRPTPPRVVGFDPQFRNPRSFVTEASLERTIGEALVISAEYLHTSSWRLQRRLDRNLFPPIIDPTGMPIFPLTRPDPAFGPISINQSGAHSDYDAIIVSVRRRLIQRFHYMASYSLSRNRDDDSNEHSWSRETALNPLDPSLERAYSNNDMRHNFNVSGFLELPHGFTTSMVMLARSGLPYTPIIGFDTQNDGNDFNDRAIINGRVAGRNSMRQDGFLDLDLRVMKEFRVAEGRRLQVSVECNNVTRNGNKYFGSTSSFGTPANPNPTAGIPLLAPSSTRFGGPRQVQLGARFVF
ncbi:MAG TPA: TonB-dependent receptor [Candidatus Dormibacteraeota bacterium]|nr:TonB-dependent receptor [Candidatus Dormibacteraeota bacterium]